MTRLSNGDILRVWEAGAAQGSVGRALAILSAASPGVPEQALAALPVGTRDAQLLEIRERTFGPTLEGHAACPRCAQQFEFTIAISDLRARAHGGVPASGEVCVGDVSVRYRQPTSADVLAATGLQDAGAARRELIARCVLE